eukprot:g6639.t1
MCASTVFKLLKNTCHSESDRELRCHQWELQLGDSNDMTHCTVSLSRPAVALSQRKRSVTDSLIKLYCFKKESVTCIMATWLTVSGRHTRIFSQ